MFVFITAVKKKYKSDNVNTTRDKVKRQRKIVLKLGSPEANMNVTCDTAILFIFFKDQTVSNNKQQCRKGFEYRGFGIQHDVYEKHQ